jgi:hypothetical protein
MSPYKPVSGYHLHEEADAKIFSVEKECGIWVIYTYIHTHTHTIIILIKRMHGITEFRPDSVCTLKKSASAV